MVSKNQQVKHLYRLTGHCTVVQHCLVDYPVNSGLPKPTRRSEIGACPGHEIQLFLSEEVLAFPPEVDPDDIVAQSLKHYEIAAVRPGEFLEPTWCEDLHIVQID